MEINFKNFQYSIRAAEFLLIATAAYQFIEFKLSDIQNKTFAQYLRASFSVILSCIALNAAHPTATLDTAYSEISLLWYFSFLAASFLIGASVSMLVYSAIMIRPKREAQQLKVPRIPFAIKAQLYFQIAALSILSTIYFTILYYSPEPTKPVGVFALIVSVIYFTLSTTYSLLLKIEPRNLRKLRDAFSAHDQRLLAADASPEDLNLLKEPPRELQKEIKSRYALPESPDRAEFKVQTLEGISINFTPKKTHPPTPPNFKLRTSEKNQSLLKVKIISSSILISNKILNLPISSIEIMAVDFLSNHNKGQDQSPHKALNYALKQVAIIEFTQSQEEAQAVDIITTGNRKLISKYLDKNTDLNEQGVNGWTPLMMAIAQGDLEIATTLLDLGADPDIKNLQNRSALHFAARYANLDSCLLLIEYGANLNIQDDIGNTPLIIATSYGSLEVVEALVKAGADIKIENHLKETALIISQKSRYGNISKILRNQANR